MPDVTLPDTTVAAFHTEDGRDPPRTLVLADDQTRAADALRAIRDGADLLWTGDWHNGRQLLTALRRRVKRPRTDGTAVTDLAAIWRAERAHTHAVADVLGRVLVRIEPGGRVALRRVPPHEDAVRHALGAVEVPTLVALPTLIGMLGAWGWHEAGVEVPGLDGRIHPHFGVFPPTRNAYVRLLDHLDFRGRTVLDTGCGTGVLGLVALQRGASRVVAVDVDPRAVACARDNAHRLGLQARFEACEADLFPDAARVDLALFNPPWLPEVPRTRLDRAVYDSGDLVRRWLAGLPLAENGRAGLLVSDLAVRLGLRPEGQLQAWIAEAGRTIEAVHDTAATHRKTHDRRDPLHEARAAERVQLWVLS